MNRFNQPIQNAGYTPLSFQELAFAPVQMRQREDRMNDAKDEIFHQMNNIVGYEGFDEETNAAKDQMRKKLEDLSAKIGKHGAGNVEFTNEFRNLRNEYNSLVSKTGALGMSSAIKESMDEQRKAFYQLALQNGQSPETIEANWQKEVGNYKQGLPSKLGDLKGQIPAFTPALPPKSQDIAAHAARLTSIMGKVKDEYKGMTFKRMPDGEGGTRIVPVDVHGVEITNAPNVDAMMNILKTDILDPRSAINQDLRWKGYTPEEYLNNVESFRNLVLEQSSSEGTDMGGTGSGRGTGSGSGSGSDKYEDEAELLDTDNSSERVAHTASTLEIDQRLDTLYRSEGVMPEDQRRQEITALNHVRKNVAEAEEKFKQTPEYIEAIDKNMHQSAKLNAYGINTYEEYQKALKNPLDFMIPGDKIDGKQTVDEMRQTLKREFMTKVEDPIVKHELEPHLANSKQMTLGFGDADKKVEKLLVEGLKTGQIMSAAMNGRLEISNNDPLNLNFERYSPNDKDEKKQQKFKEFTTAINRSDAKISFGAINSGSIYSVPEVQYTVEIPGEKESDPPIKYEFTIDLGKDDFSRALLSDKGPIYDQMDDNGKNTLNNMRENIEYMGLPTVNAFDTKKSEGYFRKNDTESIVTHANKRDRDLFKVPIIDKEQPNALEKLMLDSRFVTEKEKKDGALYSVVINDDDSYSTLKKKDGKVVHYTIGDYFEKDFISNYAMDRMDDPDAAAFLSRAEGKAYKKSHKAKLLHSIWKNAEDINDPASNMLLYSNSAEFKSVLKEYNQLVQSGTDQATIVRKAEDLFDRIAGLTLQSKRKNIAI